MELSYSNPGVRGAMFEVEGLEWEGDCRPAAQAAIKEMLEGRMRHWMAERLAELASADLADRRNGWFSRILTTEAGDVALAVRRTRTASACEVLKAYARRPAHVDRAILDCFLLGASTRKAGRIMAPYLGEGISPSTVSRIAEQPDGAVKAYPERPLAARFRFLLFDGVALKQKKRSRGEKTGGAGDPRHRRRRQGSNRFLQGTGRIPNGLRGVLERLAPAWAEGRSIRIDRHRRRQRTSGRVAIGFPSPPCSTVLGAQDPQCVEQGAQSRPASRQDRSAQPKP